MKEPTKVLFQHEFDYCYTVAASAGKTHTVCIQSICSPHEFMNRLSYIIKKKQKAVDILGRFFNRTFIQLCHIRDIMMNTLDDNENNKNNEDVEQNLWRYQEISVILDRRRVAAYSPIRVVEVN